MKQLSIQRASASSHADPTCVATRPAAHGVRRSHPGISGSYLGPLVCLLLCTVARGGEKTPIEIEDLYRVDAPAELVISPDGQVAVYIRRWADRDTRSYRTALWKTDGSDEGRRPLEEGEPDARLPVFSPDGRWIAFHSTRPLPDGSPPCPPVPPYSDAAGDIWLIPAAGGPAIPLAGTDKPYGRVPSDPFYARMAFSPDGRHLAFVADDGVDPRSPAEIANNVRVVREDQGEGYEGYGPTQIWIADLHGEPGDSAAVRVVRATHDDFWYGDPQWLPDGRSIVVHANRTDDRESVRYSINKNFDIWRIDLGDNSLHQLTTGPGPEVSPRPSPDGKRLVCLSGPRRGPHADVFNLMSLDPRGSGTTETVLFDHHAPDADNPPHLPPAFPLPQDCWLDGHRLYFQALEGTVSSRQVIDLDGGTKGGGSAGFGDELLEPRDAARRRFSPNGNSFLEERVVAPTRIVRWRSSDGLEIEGLLTVPAEGVGRQPYRLLVYPHGGPHSRSAQGFDMTVQIFAAAGYAVFQPNFRGSNGYGVRFLDADRADFGGGDMRDILSGIDHLIEAGIADRDRQFIYGVSYGGFLTSWLVGQTNQFRAAVPQNAVTDLQAMWCLSDLESWTVWEFGGRPWEVPEAMRAHSPLTHAPRVRTPTLILHAANDRRCPLPMGLSFYRTLKRSGVETEMVIYPDEGHPIKQLPHQEDVLRRVLDWFEKHDRVAH